MKLYLICLAILLYTVNAFSLDAGVLIGAGVSDIEDTDYALTSNEGGLRLGVPLKFTVNDVVFLRTGFFYSLRQFQATALPPGLQDEEFRLGYLEVPLLGQIQLSDWFAFFAGPVYGFNISNKSKIENAGEYVVNEVKKSSFLGQVGFEINFGVMAVDVIYETGFTNVFQENDGKWSYIGLNFIYWFVGTQETYDRFRY